jgi:ABC-type phosphate/phosphonate transport system substrate-binding protein
MCARAARSSPGAARRGREVPLGVHHGRADIKTLADLKGKTFSFGSQQHLGPPDAPQLPADAKVDPDKDFKRVAYSGAHDATIAAVAAARWTPVR